MGRWVTSSSKNLGNACDVAAKRPISRARRCVTGAGSRARRCGLSDQASRRCGGAPRGAAGGRPPHPPQRGPRPRRERTGGGGGGRPPRGGPPRLGGGGGREERIGGPGEPIFRAPGGGPPIGPRRQTHHQ